MSDHLDTFKLEVKAKLGSQTLEEYITAHPGEHLWARYRGLPSCAICGVVRRQDGRNQPCKGKTKIGLRGRA
jgi:hypothetical protein